MVSILWRILAVSWSCFFFKPQTLCCKRVKRITPEIYSRHLFVCFVAVSVPHLNLELCAFNFCNQALCIQILDIYRHHSLSPSQFSYLPQVQVRPSCPNQNVFAGLSVYFWTSSDLECISILMPILMHVNDTLILRTHRALTLWSSNVLRWIYDLLLKTWLKTNAGI